MSLTRLRRYSFAFLCVFCAVYYSSVVFLPEISRTLSNIYGLTGDAAAIVIFLRGLRRWPENMRRPWRIFALSVFIYMLGDAVWAYEEEILEIEILNPSVCDVFYIMSTICCFVALCFYVIQEKLDDLMNTGFDVLISVVASGGLIYNYIILPITANKDLGFWEMTVMIIYPAVDTAYIIGMFSLIFGLGKRAFNKRNLFLGMGLLLTFLADQTFLVESLNAYVSGGVLDLFWSVSFCIMSLAALWPHTPEEDAEEIHEGLTALDYFRITLPYLMTFAILGLVGVQYNLLTPFFTGAMLLMFLLSIRQIFVLIGNHRLIMVIHENELELSERNRELERLNKKFLRDSEVDFLTQLLNRRAVAQAFERLAPLDEEKETLGLLLIDVDYFKTINDTYGHQKGDDALKGVADAIRASIREGDIGGRFGGDEFLVLMPGASNDTVRNAAEKLLENSRNIDALREMNVTMSIGGTSRTAGKSEYRPNKLLRQADEALYVAKENGRNQYKIFEGDD